MTINEAFGQILRKELKARQIKVNHFASLSGISRANLYFIFKGETSPSLETMYMTANALNMTVGKLLSQTNEFIDKNS